jgi:hypothetical protein
MLPAPLVDITPFTEVFNLITEKKAGITSKGVFLFDETR